MNLKYPLLVVIIGSIVAASIDALIGVNLTKSHGALVTVAHCVTYVLWGVVMGRSFDKK